MTDQDLLLVAEKLGQALDRLDKIEGEFAAQTAPITAAGGAQAAALTALEAALAGVKALNQHVLGNDLGALSARVDEAGKQTETALSAVSAEISRVSNDLASKVEAVRAELSAVTATRRELSAETATQTERVETVRREFSAGIAGLRDELAAVAKKFATPQSVNPRGEWIDGETYARLDMVSVSGSSYISTVDGNRTKPKSGAGGWMLVAKRGGTGGGMSSAAIDASQINSGTLSTDRLGMASIADAKAGASSTLLVSPAAMLAALLNANYVDLNNTTLTQVTSGTTTGAAYASGPVGYQLYAPTTAVGGIGGRVASVVGFGWRRGEAITASTGFAFNADLRIDARIAQNAVDANSVWRITFGKSFGSSIGVLAARGFGVRRSGTGALDLVVHNGTTAATVASSFTPTTGTTFDISLQFNGATGGCQLYVNDSLVASSAAGVGTGASALPTPTFWMEIENTSTASTQSQLGIFRPRLLFGP